MSGDAETKENIDEDDISASTSSTFYASSVCGCGPEYTVKEAKRNQLLRVPRVTTDFPSLVMFGFFVVHMLVIWFFAMDKGQYLWLMNGMDWRGKVCGAGDLATKPKQFWMNPLMPNIWTGAICVEDCPAPANNQEIDKNIVVCVCNPKYWPEKFSSSLSPSTYSQELITGCSDPKAQQDGYFIKELQSGSTLRDDTKTGPNGGSDQPCAYLYRSKWAMHKCVPWLQPSNMQEVVEQTQTAGKVTTDFVEEWLQESPQIFSTFMVDVAQSLYVVTPCLFLAMMFSLTSMVLLRYWVEAFAKGILYVFLGLLIATTVMMWTQYEYYSNLADEVPQNSTHTQDKQSMYVFLTCFIVCCVFCVVHLCFSIYMNYAIGAAISVIKVASQSFQEAPQILLYPLVHVVSFAALLVFWLMGAIMLYCSGDIETASNGVAYMEHTPYLRSCIWSYIWGFIWIAGFMNGLGYMIVAGTIYISTFAQPKNLMYPEKVKGVAYSGERHVPDSVMTASACIMIRYHMGTAALGSFILSIVWIFRGMASFFAWFGRLAEGDSTRTEEEGNTVSKFTCCCCRCAMWTFESCLKYMNKMAYLQTVLHGYSFCGAAFEGLECVMKGINYVSDTTLISSFVLVIIKFSISFTVTFIAVLLVKSGSFGVNEADMTYCWVPYLLTVSCAYVLCTAFMIITEVAIDAIMVAFCEAKFEAKGAIKDHQLSKQVMAHMESWGKWGSENEPFNSASSERSDV